MALQLDSIVCILHFPTESLQRYLKEVKHAIPLGGDKYALHPLETPHLRALQTGDYTFYEELIRETKQVEHSVERFRKLRDTFEIAYMAPIIVEYVHDVGKYTVMDGVHRLALLLLQGIVKTAVPFSIMRAYMNKKACDALKEKLRLTTGDTKYNGWSNRTEFGYHSYRIFNFAAKGQRDPLSRLSIMKRIISFQNKRVLDIGCNTGGMLFHIPEISVGVGIDYDQVCIDTANAFKKVFQFANQLEFVCLDLDATPLVLDKPYDVAFLLSVGSWIKTWRTLYRTVYAVTKLIFLETNNDVEGVDQLNFFHALGAKIHIISHKSDDDSTGNIGRKMYAVYDPKWAAALKIVGGEQTCELRSSSQRGEA